jgi:hypothetical protein
MLCWQRVRRDELQGVNHSDTQWYREDLQRSRLLVKPFGDAAFSALMGVQQQGGVLSGVA